MFDFLPFGGRQNPIFDYFDQFDRAFFDGLNSVVPFKTDIVETSVGYQLQAELPGFKKEDISIDMDGGRLTIKAEHTVQSEEMDKGSYLRRERSYGAFARSFALSGIDEEGVTADYENGVLTLTLPKKAEKVFPARRIDIR